MKNKKVVIGFIGDHGVGKTTAANMLVKRGFYRVSINDKVEEFARHLCTDEEMATSKNLIVNKIRRKGCEVHKEYWLNLVLISVPDDKDYIVFDDLSADEVEVNKIKSIQIYRPDISGIRLDNIETIENDGNIGAFSEKISKLCEKLIGKKSR